jgi:CRP-like cAMP-binding protein
VDDLRRVKLFSTIPEDVLSAIKQKSIMSKHSAGESILCEGDPDVPISFILSGRVRIYRTNPEGREQTLTYLDAGDVFNLPTAFLQNGAAPASVAAEEETRVLNISPAYFREMTSSFPALGRIVMVDLSEKLEHLANLVHDVSLRSVRSRLARFLLIQKQLPTQVNWTQEQIAMQIGSTREGVSRAMKELIRAGLIKTERQHIQILDDAALRNESE